MMKYHSRLRGIHKSAGPAVDPNFADVTLLTGFEGYPTYVDESSLGHTLTPNIPTGFIGQSAGGGRAGTDAMAYNGGAHLSTPAHVGWDFGSGDFTIEANIKPQAAYSGADGGFLGAQSVTNTGWFFAINGAAGGSVAGTSIYFWAVNVAVFEYSHAFTANTWYDVAVQREGIKFTIFVDGVPVGSTNNAGVLTGGTLRIGNPTTVDAAIGGMQGQLDEVRITKGVARYDSVLGYTPDPAIFPRQ